MPTDPQKQAIYDELLRRGAFKNDPDLAAMGHKLRAAGIVTDPTQGGIVAPAGAVRPGAAGWDSADGPDPRQAAAPMPPAKTAPTKSAGTLRTALDNTFGTGDHEGDIHKFFSGIVPVAKTALDTLGAAAYGNDAGQIALLDTLTGQSHAATQAIHRQKVAVRDAARTGAQFVPGTVKDIGSGHAADIPGNYAREATQHPFSFALNAAAVASMGAEGLLAKAGTLERLGAAAAKAGDAEGAAHLAGQAAKLRRLAQPVHDVATGKVITRPVTKGLKSFIGKATAGARRDVAAGKALTEGVQGAALPPEHFTGNNFAGNKIPNNKTPNNPQAEAPGRVIKPFAPPRVGRAGANIVPKPPPDVPMTAAEPPDLPKKPQDIGTSPAPDTQTVPNFPTDQLRTDPERFQYKMGAGQGGQTGSLSGAPSFNQDLAGVVHAWTDPADGQHYIVNGHNRYALAVKSGAPGLDTRFLDAATAEEARTQGAMINIAEGQGTALDAAKLFRDQKITPEELGKQNITVKGEKARQGMALANLAPPLFAQAVRGELPVERAVTIGEKLPDHGDQMALVSQVDKAQKSGRQLTNGQVGELADSIAAGPRLTTTETNLFGDETTSKSTALERAEVADYLRTQMGQEGGAFKNAAKNAGRLAKGNNVIDAERSKELAQLNDQGKEVFARLKNSPGPVSDILNAAAVRLARGENPNVVKSDALNQFHDALPGLIKSGGDGESSAAGNNASAAGGAAPGLFDAGGDPVAGPAEGPPGGDAPGQDGGAVHPQPADVAPGTETLKAATDTAKEQLDAARADQEAAKEKTYGTPADSPERKAYSQSLQRFHDAVDNYNNAGGELLKHVAPKLTAPSTEAGGFSSPRPNAPNVPANVPEMSQPAPGRTALHQPAPSPRDGIVLQSTILPGADKFVEQDVIPTVKAAAGHVRSIAGEIRQTLSPSSVSPDAAQTARTVRENAGQLAQKRERSVAALKSLAKAFDAMPPADNYAFIHTMETGGVQPTPELQAAAKTLRGALNERRAQVQALGTGKLDTFIANYFPHIWEDPKKAGGVFGAFFGKRPLEGPKSFLKKRTLPTLADGLAAGLKPVTDNPVELSLLKMHEMDRFVMGQRILAELKGQGLAKFVKATEKAPDGWTKIDDKIATVHGPLTDEGAVTIRGYYYAPDDAARVLNNYLSPGLRGHSWFQGLQYGGNVLNQAQLGLSAFHLGFTAMDSATSKFALGVEQNFARASRARDAQSGESRPAGLCADHKFHARRQGAARVSAPRHDNGRHRANRGRPGRGRRARQAGRLLPHGRGGRLYEGAAKRQLSRRAAADGSGARGKTLRADHGADRSPDEARRLCRPGAG